MYRKTHAKSHPNLLTINSSRSANSSPYDRFRFCRPVGRDGRVAEGARLESVYTFTGIVGSNPTLSAVLDAFLPISGQFLYPKIAGIGLWNLYGRL